MLTSTGDVHGAVVAKPLSDRLGSTRATVAVQLMYGSTALLIPLAESDWRVILFVIGQFMVGLGVDAGNVIKSSCR